MLNTTHAAGLRSWVDGANDPSTDFPIQNLPYGVFRRAGSDEAWRVGVAIGDQVLDVAAAADAGLLHEAGIAADACRGDHAAGGAALNALMALGPAHWTALRTAVSRLLRDDTDEGGTARRRGEMLVVAQGDAELRMPAHVGDYTDFYASVHHATNVGSMFRPDNPLLPNYKWVPIGYHGRASSIVVSGHAVRRPVGQLGVEEGGGAPVVAPSRRLDYEAEIGFYVGEGNSSGTPIGIAGAARHLFGVTLLNDWSARDVQAWEYQPLGPFLAKNFLTTVSPWIVTFDALAPFRAPASPRAEGDPAPLDYLADAADQAAGGVDMAIEVWIRTARMRADGVAAVRLSRGNARDMYWTPAQLLAHHASGGCNLRPGDLLGSGTLSGATPDSRGCLLELAWRGSAPVQLPGGEERRFLEDGDEVTLRGACERDGFRRLGFGACTGVVVPP